MNKQFCLSLGYSHSTTEVPGTTLGSDRVKQSIEVSMPDGSTHVLTTLLSQANHKQVKGAGYLSVGLTLTPRATGRAGRTLCPFATPGCAASCFADYDRLAWPKNKRVAVARTRLLAQSPEQFLALLVADLARQKARAERLGVPLVCRLNVVSDVPFEQEFPALFSRFPDVQFMDYTKDPRRLLNPDRPRHYHLTFSRSERNESDCLRVLEAGGNVAVVFRKPPFPHSFWGYPVINGDQNDLRFLDPRPCIVGLKAKGKGARQDQTGFVLDTPSLPPPENDNPSEQLTPGALQDQEYPQPERNLTMTPIDDTNATNTPHELPPDPEGMNDRRAAWAEFAIAAFMAATGTDREDALPDLLADLMHWSDRQDYDFEAALGRARHHYEAETTEQ